MKLTNQNNLPDVFVRAIQKNEQPPTALSDVIRVSDLIAPPQIVQLNRENYENIEEDVTSKLWQLYGTLMHLLLEQASEPNSSDILEQTYRVEFEKMTVTGTPDIISGDVLSDYKNTSVYAIKTMLQEEKVKDEWLWQTNVYRYLYECDSTDIINTIKVIAIARDWRQGE